MIAERLGAHPLVLQVPLGGGSDFGGVIDLVAMHALIWDDGAALPRVSGIPPDVRVVAQHMRHRLLETVAEVDEGILHDWLHDAAAIEEARLKQAIRQAVLACRLTPVLCGSAHRNIGVQPLLDAIVDYAPSPADRPPVEGIEPRTGVHIVRRPDADEPFTALVSKVQPSRFGSLAFVRVYSGRVARGDLVVNAATGRSERVGRVLRMHADDQEEIGEAGAGDVVAFVGLKTTGAGETLSDPAHPIVLVGFDVPAPVIEAAIEPLRGEDGERLSQALAAMARADPSLRVGVDAESGRTIVTGMGELHLQIAVETLKEDFGIAAALGAPSVAWRAAPTRRAEVDHLLRKQSGGPGQMARVRLVFEPAAESGLTFENRIVGGAIPREFVPAIEKALEQALRSGGPGGVPVLGLRAILVGGAFHEKDSSALAFELATREAFRIGFAQTAPVVLEPLMQVEIRTPADYLGAVIGDLQRRRGQVLGTEPEQAGQHRLLAEVPLGEMFSYVGALRSLSQGRATFTMRFARYAEMPRALWPAELQG
jgi:elongation factor G